MLVFYIYSTWKYGSRLLLTSDQQNTFLVKHCSLVRPTNQNYRGTCKVTLGVIPVSLLGLPVVHVLVVTHLFGCVEIEIIALFLSWHEGD